ncbi:MAG TPA: GNAT family N-acetyltransferase [Rhodopila sp.]|nr:GNAT family N-acetyltransferase [Rhodopila sp.]
MPTTGSADPTVETFETLEALPPDALALFDRSAEFFGSRLWWSVVLAHAVPKNASPMLAAVRVAGRYVALLPLLQQPGGWHSLTPPYSCAFTPAVAAGIDADRALIALARFCRSAAVTRLDCLPAEWVGLSPLRTAAVRAGLRPLSFDHFGNWYEDVGGLDWASYLRLRPGALRETVRRRVRKAESLTNLSFDIFTDPADMDRAVAAYESVYRRSWKAAELFPDFNAALIRATAEAGWLRLGILSNGLEPVAAQFWVVRDKQAVVLKLAHDEAFKAHSPGTVLTAFMLRHLLDREHVARIDFGRGDDSYKQGWASSRRQRVGMLLVNPFRLGGLAAWLRHTGGRARTKLRSNP